MAQDDVRCPGFEAAYNSGDVQAVIKEPQKATNGPVSYLIGIRIASGISIDKLFDTSSTKIHVFGMGFGHEHPSDTSPRLWAWYEVWCQTGPPCSFLEALSTQQKQQLRS
jgi:hypothetical protein